MSHFDEIDVGDLSNITLNCHIYYIVVNKVFLQFTKCEKYIFLKITDSVMNSHIYCIDVLLDVQMSDDVSLPWNGCFRSS